MTDSGIRFTGYEVTASNEEEHTENVLIHTNQGDVAGLFYRASDSEAAVLWAGSWRGNGQASPIARSVAQDLLKEGVSSLLLRYRRLGELPPCIRDTEAGISFLNDIGIRRIALVGHSFSGAVVISVAPLSQAVVAVVALASQTYGAATVRHVSPRPLLLVHGTADERLDPYCSEQIYSWARKPKELYFMEGASHSLWDARDDLLPLLRDWLMDKLRKSGQTKGHPEG